MAVRSKSYELVPNMYWVTIPELAYRNIKCVKLDGMNYNILLEGTPDNGQVVYLSNRAMFMFNNAFSPPPPPIPVGGGLFIVTDSSAQKLFIIWDE